MVRVVIPTFNRASLLGDAVNSVLRQSFKDFELLVVDDGSTDDTEALVRELMRGDGRVRYQKQKNGGVASARNRGIDCPRAARYVAFLDSDDTWSLNHLERSVAVLESYRDIALVCSRREYVDVQGTLSREGAMDSVRRKFDRALAAATPLPLERAYVLSSSDCHRLLLHSEFAPWTSSVVVRGECVQRSQWFDPRLEVLEDVDFCMDLAVHPFGLIDQVAGLYRYFGDNLTGSRDLGSPVTLRRQLAVLEFLKKKIGRCSNRRDRAFVRKEIAATAYLIGQCCSEQRDRPAARQAYLEALGNRFSWHGLRGLIGACVPPLLRRAYLASRS